MKLHLSATEGRKILVALHDLAIERGWDEDELDESGVLAEYGAAVDAAMNAIGMTVDIDPDEEWEEDEEDEEDMESIIFDVDGHRTISASDARLLMGCVAKVLSAQYGWLPDEVLEACVKSETARIADVYGIEMVEGE